MARYFFHLIDGTFQPDQIGEELPTVEAAQRSAIVHAANAVAGRGEGFWDGDSFKIAVTDVTGAVLFEISMAGKEFASARGRPAVNGKQDRDIVDLGGDRLVVGLQFTGRATKRDGATQLEAFDGSDPVMVFVMPQVLGELKIEAVKSKAKEKYAAGIVESDRSVWLRPADFPTPH